MSANFSNQNGHTKLVNPEVYNIFKLVIILIIILGFWKNIKYVIFLLFEIKFRIN
jgi:hypothetical protein